MDIALDALRLIEVDYEVLPAALIPREAMKPAAPLVPILDVERPREGNIQQPVYVRERGDLEQGLAAADLVSESRVHVCPRSSTSTSRPAAAWPTGTANG